MLGQEQTDAQVVNTQALGSGATTNERGSKWERWQGQNGACIRTQFHGDFLRGGVALVGVGVSSQEGGSRRPQIDCEGISWLSA